MTVDLIGKTLRGYELLDLIGTGGFGAVYRARQQIVDREVAVKVILPEYANSPAFVRRFETEAQFIARLEHPHIVPLFDYWRDADGAYLVMRYVRNGSLKRAVAEQPFTLEQTARALDQITAALSLAHRQGVVHLDIKPDNLLLDVDGNFYLTDFGIARAVGTDPHDTGERRVSGTIAYAAPEQLQSRRLSQQADIYSLGLILFEMLTGEHPFAGMSITQMIMAHLAQSLPTLTDHQPDLPRRINDIIQRATAKDPAFRYDDVRQIFLDFQVAIERQSTHLTAENLTALAEIKNPYQGLRPFEEADAAMFFGRGTVVASMVQRIAMTRFLAAVGASGSGKSSVVNAGVLPALRHDALPGSSSWFIAQMLPGNAPFVNLAAVLSSLATRPIPSILGTLRDDVTGLANVVRHLLPHDEEGDLLLVIDQFEELFTQTAETNREPFLNMLHHAVTQPDSRLRVLVTLRADFYDRPLQYPEFGALIQQHTEVVLPLSTTELEEAIVGPAEKVGMSVDAELTATIVADVREEPGALPLLQYALTEVFERREGDRKSVV
jgi:hypothetical protein